jgi:hypothetical protein
MYANSRCRRHLEQFPHRETHQRHCCGTIGALI